MIITFGEITNELKKIKTNGYEEGYEVGVQK